MPPILLLILCAGLWFTGSGSLAHADDDTAGTIARLQSASSRAPQLSNGSSQLGGAFTAQNQNGVPLTEKSFAGSYMLLTFGYTSCGDNCTPAPQVMTAALAQLAPDKAAKVYPVFVTLDPARDTPPVLKGFLARYSPRFVGLTGSPGEIDRLTAAYHAYGQRVEDPGTAIERRLSPQDLAALRQDPAYQPSDPNAYTIDHSRGIYLVDPAGKVAAVYGPSTQAAELAKALSDNVE